MKHDLTKLYEGDDLTGYVSAIADVIYLPIVRAATLKAVSIVVDEAQVGDAVFSLFRNGVEITGAGVTVTNGNRFSTKSGLNVVLAVGDEITLNVSSGNVNAPVTLSLETDDGETVETQASLGTLIAGATAKTSPVDADVFGYSDSAASNVLKKFTWLNLKAALKAVFDSIYVTGALSATDSAIALFDGTTGELIKDSGKTISTDGTFAANSDNIVPSQKAVKTYVANNAPAPTAAGIGGAIAGATTKAAPVDADLIGFADTEASNALKKFTFTNLKALLKTYFDTIYAPAGGGSSSASYESVTWTNAVNCAVEGTRLKKNAGGSAFNAGASSYQKISGDGGLRFPAQSPTSRSQFFGLSYSDTNQNFTSINFCYSINDDNTIDIYESGTGVATNIGSFTAGATVLEITRAGTSLVYKLNGTTKRTTTTTSAALVADTTLYYNNSTIEILEIKKS